MEKQTIVRRKIPHDEQFKIRFVKVYEYQSFGIDSTTRRNNLYDLVKNLDQVSKLNPEYLAVATYIYNILLSKGIQKDFLSEDEEKKENLRNEIKKYFTQGTNENKPISSFVGEMIRDEKTLSKEESSKRSEGEILRYLLLILQLKY